MPMPCRWHSTYQTEAAVSPLQACLHLGLGALRLYFSIQLKRKVRADCLLFFLLLAVRTFLVLYRIPIIFFLFQSQKVYNECRHINMGKVGWYSALALSKCLWMASLISFSNPFLATTAFMSETRLSCRSPEKLRYLRLLLRGRRRLALLRLL